MARLGPKFWCLFLLLTGVVGTASATESSTRAPKWLRGVYVAESPPAQPVPQAVAWDAARAAAAKLGGVAIRGSGGSMQPLYAPGTILIVAKQGFENLARGQTVVYRSRRASTVAHVLVARCVDGWRVAGLANRTHDDEGVRQDNLLGVVVAAFVPVDGPVVASR